jgi:protein O-GlcNAc transferase
MTGEITTVQEALEQAITHHEAQRWAEAERLYRAILEAYPRQPDANHNLGVLAVQIGQPEGALPHLKTALDCDPARGQFWVSYIDALLAARKIGDAKSVLDSGLKQGLAGEAVETLSARIDEGLRAIVERVALDPGGWDTACYAIPDLLAAAHHQHAAGRLEEAEMLYRRILSADPSHADALNLMGVLAYRRGRYEEAAALIAQAIAINDKAAIYHLGHASALEAQGRLDEAAAGFERAVALSPEFAEALYRLGNVFLKQGKTEAAVARYEQAVAANAGFAEALNNLGNALKELGRLEEAIARYEQALALQPDIASAYSNLGNALLEQGRLEEAVARYRQALVIDPKLAQAKSNLGTALQAQGKLDEAVACYEQALALKPDYWDALYNLGRALTAQGKDEEAIACYERVLDARPGDSVTCCNLFLLSAARASFDPSRHLAHAHRWEIASVGDAAALRNAADLRRRPLAGRKLRLGYVSGNYRRHSVSYFIEQLFGRHDRNRVELFAYSTASQEDEVTRRIRSLVDHWEPLAALSDAAARARIMADEIDLLVDLSGWTLDNRLAIFALRAAPVQVHYLGFYASTGLSQMDYWIGDATVTPPETDAQFSETVWRLPRVWVSYDAKGEAPPPAWQPARDGSLWYGSFNILPKLTNETLALWGRVLRAVPEGRLLLKTEGLDEAINRRRILDALAAQGVAASRVELVERSATPDWPQHMSYYDRVDVALDPVGGVGGGTTSCDALWMGVPVITMEGSRMPTRMTSSMLHAIGRPEWIARDEQEYVDKAVSLARDVTVREALRSAQRACMAASPLCDAAGLARALEDAFFTMAEKSMADHGA